MYKNMHKTFDGIFKKDLKNIGLFQLIKLQNSTEHTGTEYVTVYAFKIQLH